MTASADVGRKSIKMQVYTICGFLDHLANAPTNNNVKTHIMVNINA